MANESRKTFFPGQLDVPNKLRQRLESLGAESIRIESPSALHFHNEPSRKMPDFLLNFHFRDHVFSYFLEWKKQATPQIIRDWILVYSIPQKIQNGSKWMLCSAFISEEAAQNLEENGIDFLDLSGNALLTQNSLFVKIREKNKNPFSESKLVSAFRRSSVVSSRIFRTMLEKASRSWRYEELQKASGCSQGQIRKVKVFLQENGFLKEDKNGFRISDLPEFLKVWGKEYQKRKDTVIHGYSFDSIAAIEKKVAILHSEGFPNLVLTGFSAAARWKPTARYQKAELLVSPDQAEKLLDRLNLKRVESGGNVDLTLAYDPVVFQGFECEAEVPCASPVQVCLDLSERGGRSEEAIDAIIMTMEEKNAHGRTGIDKGL